MNKSPVTRIENETLNTLGICALVGVVSFAVFYGTKGIVKKLREKNMQRIIDNYGCIIQKYASRYGVDPMLVTAVILRESSGNPNATNKYSSAKGLMQLIDSTAKDMGVTNSFDPEQNIMGGTKYLSLQLQKFGDMSTSVAAYHDGPGNVEESNYAMSDTTKTYVNRVMNSYNAVTSDVWQELVCN